MEALAQAGKARSPEFRRKKGDSVFYKQISKEDKYSRSEVRSGHTSSESLSAGTYGHSGELRSSAW